MPMFCACPSTWAFLSWISKHLCWKTLPCTWGPHPISLQDFFKRKGGSTTSLLEREEILSTASLAGINAKLGIGKVFWEQLPMTEIEAHWAFCRGHLRAKIRTKAPSKVFASGGVLLFLQDHLPYTLALTALTWLSRFRIHVQVAFEQWVSVTSFLLSVRASTQFGGRFQSQPAGKSRYGKVEGLEKGTDGWIC